jgi:2,3-bisphosphoglycerate-dependent phosphoglycerate mutase
MATTTVYLVRHAQSNPTEGMDHSDWPLSVRGRGQADALAELLLPLRLERIISSPFTRCRQTIQPLAERTGLAIDIRDDLRERHLGVGFDDDFQVAWRRSWEDFDFALPGLETSWEAQRRFVAAMRLIVNEHDGRTIAVCAHGNVIGLFLYHLDARNGRETAERLKNPDVLRFTAESGAIVWDQAFRLPGLADVVTDPAETPITRT